MVPECRQAKHNVKSSELFFGRLGVFEMVRPAEYVRISVFKKPPWKCKKITDHIGHIYGLNWLGNNQKLNFLYYLKYPETLPILLINFCVNKSTLVWPIWKLSDGRSVTYEITQSYTCDYKRESLRDFNVFFYHSSNLKPTK